MIPFGPQLIGQTEKTLNAVLRTFLVEDGLTEEQWVALRLTAQFTGDGDLAEFIREASHFEYPAQTLATLEQRNLITGHTLTDDGREMLARIGADIAERTAVIWEDLPDAECAERALNVVHARYRDLLRQRA